VSVSPIFGQADELASRAQSISDALTKAARDKAGPDVDFARVLQAATSSQTSDAGTTTASPGGVAGEYDLTGASALSSGTGSADALGTDATTVTGDDVVADAKKYLGVPYQWGGTDPDTGLDCSGLTQLVYSELGYSIPRVSADQATVGQAVDSLADAKPGDLLFFGSPVHHVAIYMGNNQMIEAPHTGEDVRISDVWDTPTHIRRIVGDSSLLSDGGGTASAVGATGTTPYAAVFTAASARTGVSARLLEAVAQEESGFDANAVSGAGAQGIMQLMPSTAESLGVDHPFNAAESINGAATYLRSLLQEFNGNTSLALAAYNAGPGAVTKYGGIPPYAETQKYVKDVESLMEAR